MGNKMGKNGVIFVVIGVIILLFFLKGWGADWVSYGEIPSGELFLDVESITQPSNNIVRVWTKQVLNKKGINDTVRVMGEEFREISQILNYVEYDCAERKMRIISTISYSKKNQVLDSMENFDWIFLPPDSVSGKLFIDLCKHMRKGG